MTSRPRAREVVQSILDPGTFHSWDQAVDIGSHSAVYESELADAEERSGEDEAVLTGFGTLRGRPVAVIVSEFRFLGGSIGVAAATRIVETVQRATRQRLPLLAFPASGGTRMQEGTRAFLRMLDIARSIVAHKAAKLPYLVYLRHPTMGGVFASWGSQGHLTFAEPGALIGFIGPRVYAALHGSDFPAEVQQSENLVSQGVLDGVATLEEFAELANRALGLMLDGAVGEPTRGGEPSRTQTSWKSVLLSRRPHRPGTRDVLELAGQETIALRSSPDTVAIVAALTRLGGQPCILVGQDRTAQAEGALLGAAALREVQRVAGLAEELSLPLVAIIDTPGAELSPRAENDAIAAEIARCIAQIGSLGTPTVSVLLGEGGGGGALALFAGQRVVAAEHSWLAPLPPEAASALVHGETEYAAALADQQRIGAFALREDGAVHRIVAEDTDPGEFCRAVGGEVSWQIRELYAEASRHAATTESREVTSPKYSDRVASDAAWASGR